jgi:hypothetical protein
VPLTATLDSEDVSALVALNWNDTNLVTNPTFRQQSTYATARTNQAMNPSLSVNSSFWSANYGGGNTGAASRLTGGPTVNGQTLNYYSAALTSTAGTTSQNGVGIFLGGTTTDAVGVTGATPQAFSFWLRTSVARPMSIQLQYYDAANAVVGSYITGPTFTTEANVWARRSLVDTPPATATHVLIRCYGMGSSPATTVGDTWDATGILSESVSFVGDYFDGGSPAAAETGWVHLWTGTAGASTSTERALQILSGTNIAAYTAGGVVSGKVTDDEVQRFVYNGIATNTIFAYHASGNVPLAEGERACSRLQARYVSGDNIPMNFRELAYNAAGSSMSFVLARSDGVLLPADGSWADVILPSEAAAPTGVGSVRLLLYRNAVAPNGFTIEVRHVTTTKTTAIGEYPTAYFDGNTDGFHWNGTADNSTSTIDSATTATIERVNLSTGSVLGVRNAEPAPLIVGQWLGQDYEAPLDVDFYYRATSPDVPGVELLSRTYSIPALDRSMLKHPGRPALNASVRIGAAPNMTRPVTQGVFEVLGRTTPVAVSMRRSAARGELQVVTLDEDERDALLLLLDDGTPLLLQTPSGYGVGNIYVAVGELSEERVTGLGAEWARRWTLPFVVVDRPVGEALAVGNTWADVLASYTSWDAMRTAEGTWAGVLEGLGS